MQSKDNEIDVLEIFKVLWNSKILILSSVLIISSISLIISLFLTNLYTSSALLEVEDYQNNSNMQGLSRYSGLASLAGISIPGGASSKTDYVIETVKSRDFLEHLLTFEGVRENLFAAKSYDPTTKKIEYYSDLYDSSKDKWIRSYSANRYQIPSHLEIYPLYRDLLDVSLDSETNFINITFTHLSPIFVNDFIDLIVRELNLLSKEKDLNESKLALDFLEKQLENVRQSDIRESISELIESQLETKMLANIRKDYLISYIDESYIPEIKSSPRRLIILLLSIFISFSISILFVLLRHFTFKKS